jgi:hypothetical protein
VTHRWSEIGEKGLDWLQALGRRTSADSVVAGSGLEAQLPLHRHLLSVVFAHPIHLIPVHRSRARWRLAGLERPRGKVGSPALLRSVSRRIRLFSLVYGSVSTATLWHRRGRPLANVAVWSGAGSVQDLQVSLDISMALFKPHQPTRGFAGHR